MKGFLICSNLLLISFFFFIFLSFFPFHNTLYLLPPSALHCFLTLPSFLSSFPDVSLVQWGKSGVQRTIAQLPVSAFGTVDHLCLDSRSLYLSRLHADPSATRHHSRGPTCFPAPSQAPFHWLRSCVSCVGPTPPAQRTYWRVFFAWAECGGWGEGKK